MKRKGVAIVSVLCVVLLAASGVDAKPKPTKPPKPEKPDRPNLTTECIVFMDNEKDTNDTDSEHVYLMGGQECATVGCCPNGGPPAQFRMTLYKVWYTPAGGGDKVLLDEDPVIGYMFMNGFGRNAPYEGWKVQFWTVYYPERRPVGGDFFFQVRGGTGGRDRKTKVTVVEFLDDEDATLWVYYDENPDCSFPSETGCEPCLNGMETGCDPWEDPEGCLYPCWIQQDLTNVSFRIVRTGDLTYSGYGVTCSDTLCFP